jgi:hypothetical protein
MNCCSGEPDPRLAGLLGEARALLQHGVGEAHDPLDAGAGGRGHLLGGLAGADAGLDHPRGQAVVGLDLAETVGVAARRGPEPVVDGQLEALPVVGPVAAVDGEDQAAAVLGQAHEAQGAHGRPPRTARTGPRDAPGPRARLSADAPPR